jgi:peptide-methionine (S)-S-oxide reductase
MKATVVALLAGFTLLACKTSGTDTKGDPMQTTTQSAVRRSVGTDPGGVGAGTALQPRPGHALAAFAAGCFWGVEDNFRQVPGVVATAVGYTGGRTTNPTYETVCSHTTGHAETVLVEFDPNQVSYEDLLRIFFMNHDPTTKNRQGPDIGDQYRSAIFTFDDAQDAAARAASESAGGRLGKPVTTQISRIGPFWKAEAYHQQYDEKTGTHSCPLPKGLRKAT